MVEMVEILDGRLGKRSVERVRYVIHLVVVKYGVISLVLCISTRLLLVTILSPLVKYLVIYFMLTRVISLLCNSYTMFLGIIVDNCPYSRGHLSFDNPDVAMVQLIPWQHGIIQRKLPSPTGFALVNRESYQR